MRRRASLLLVLAAVVAGVTRSAEAAHTPQAHWKITTLAVQGKSFSYAEPEIVAGPNPRTMVIVAAGSSSAVPPTLWISRNGGASWTVGHDFDTTGDATGDADALIGPDGHMYAVNLGYNPNPQKAPNTRFLVFRSRHGHTWSGPAPFPAGAVQEPDRPWLVANPHQPDNVDMVSSVGGRNVVIWRSSDHGATFTGPAHISPATNSLAGVAIASRPLFDPSQTGRMFTVYETAAKIAPPHGKVYEIPFTQIWLATSTDAGRRWSRRVVLNTSRLSGALKDAVIGHVLVASAIDRHGNLYVAFSLRRKPGTRTTLYLTHSTTHGRTWSSPQAIDSPLRSNVMPALAVSPGGGVAYLSWYGSSNGDFRSPHASWGEMFAVSTDPLATHPHFAISRVTRGQPVHVGGINSAGAFGSDTGANWGLRDFQSIVIGPCEEPQLAWADDNGMKATQTALIPTFGCP